MLIINGTVHPMDGPVIPHGYVELEGEKIARVGAMEELKDTGKGEVLDAEGGHIVPGFVEIGRASCRERV